LLVDEFAHFAVAVDEEVHLFSLGEGSGPRFRAGYKFILLCN
jgi:hypothetical protein